MKCRLTDINIKEPCPVSKCMWRAARDGKCLSEIASSSLWAQERGIDIAGMTRAQTKAVANIQKTVILYRYLSFVRTLSKVRKVIESGELLRGVKNKSSAELQQELAELVTPVVERPLFQIHGVAKWSAIDMVLALEPKVWSAFARSSNTTFSFSLNQILGMNKLEYTSLQTGKRSLFRVSDLNKLLKDPT